MHNKIIFENKTLNSDVKFNKTYVAIATTLIITFSLQLINLLYLEDEQFTANGDSQLPSSLQTLLALPIVE